MRKRARFILSLNNGRAQAPTMEPNRVLKSRSWSCKRARPRTSLRVAILRFQTTFLKLHAFETMRVSRACLPPSLLPLLPLPPFSPSLLSLHPLPPSFPSSSPSLLPPPPPPLSPSSMALRCSSALARFSPVQLSLAQFSPALRGPGHLSGFRSVAHMSISRPERSRRNFALASRTMKIFKSLPP